MSAEIVCFGGAHVDSSAYSQVAVVAGASNPVHRRTSIGGVARNVAVRLAGAGVTTALVSRIGADADGRCVLDDLTRHGVACTDVQIDPDLPTAHYAALIDPAGELVVGWADMGIYDHVTPPSLAATIARCQPVGGWFIDSNLPAATLHWIATQCPATTWLAADTISPSKAIRLKGILAQLDYLFCNRLAAATLLGVSVEHKPASLARELTACGVGAAIVTDGPRGLALGTANAVLEYPPPVERVTGDVTGAGDSLVAGTLAALAGGQTIFEAIEHGLAAARLTLGRRGA